MVVRVTATAAGCHLHGQLQFVGRVHRDFISDMQFACRVNHDVIMSSVDHVNRNGF